MHYVLIRFSFLGVALAPLQKKAHVCTKKAVNIDCEGHDMKPTERPWFTFYFLMDVKNTIVALTCTWPNL